MIEIRIHGRGGQGGVTLAKLISTSRYLLGDSVQAFGVYAAERSGAPLQAFCRYDADAITNRNLIYEPDHVIVLDPTLVHLGVTKGLRPGGWILINTADGVGALDGQFDGYRVATIDATSIARTHKLGTASVPIVNTALLGAFSAIMGFPAEDAERALEHLGFMGGNIDAARDAFEQVQTTAAQGEAAIEHPTISKQYTHGLIDGNVGAMPRIKTGDWATQEPRRQRLVPPCNFVCPAGNDVQGFLAAMAHDDADEAVNILLQTTPFPSVCGRVCPAPCMDSCNRIGLDGPVNVRDLERFAGDHGQAAITPPRRRDESIGIIGAGPAGLTAAYHLALLGYRVTIYERDDEPGGLLRSGIPAYRLPRDVLEKEIQRILDLGVNIETDDRVDKDALILLCKYHDALLVATGLQKLRELNLGSREDTVVEQGIDFLDRTNRGELRVDGDDIVVVGGGNTAFDAARSALRLGARSVRIVYRRTREEMPAIDEEIDQAIEEGVEVDFLTLPVSIHAGVEGRDSVLICRRMELGEPDESGRRRPVEIEGSDFELLCDRVLLALGQSPELSVFPTGTEVHGEDELIGVLPVPVFAIGDLATNEGTVTAAIGSGRRAAAHVHEAFTEEHLLPEPFDPDQVIRTAGLRMQLFDKAAQDVGTTVAPEIRRFNYEEVHLGVEDASEAQRCLSCGVCNECDRCVTYCPDGVITRVGKEFYFDYEYCKGCGICAEECPRNVIVMDRL